MAIKSAIAITITFFIVFFTKLTLPQQISAVDSDCTDRWIHIRTLPSRFNLDLLATCNQYPTTDDLCPFLANHGLGPKTHARTRSWYRTDPLLLELVFHRRILEYPCLTPDPNLASAIYLPYYAGFDSLRFLYGPDQNSSSDHGSDLFRVLTRDSPEIWSRHSGHDHFLVMARPAWDFSQPLTVDPPIWGTSFLERPEFFNVTALTLESRFWPWQEQAVPYPTSFHPHSLPFYESWIRRVRRSRRTTLMLFAGGGGTSSSPNIRRSIRLECSNLTEPEIEPEISSILAGNGQSKICEFVDCSNGVCEHDPIRYMRPMLQSTFCLQPPGDTPTRRATFDGILAGCIPVFFEDLTAKMQYQWHLPSEEFSEFAVTIAKEDIVYRGERIADVLMNIPREEVVRKRERVIDLIPRVMYRRHGASVGLMNKKDAFDIAIDGVLQKIKDRVQGMSDH
ncbi:PREDICTED: probable xyloglucan galactosyltransferase GT19 isoform X3 [Tarenaya hassleriana]|uniref:probable xyloglucan galactosyltransferase GT19 isoform X1 n=1 Tax=Tarenaya hassleriana TaxID=28532 RepID=UPI00053C990A|nr:PREDICTED: probable xyloglucan galactosyltransferase GT19 isoform X1 [Tarenaya hassleriana]XP_010539746.1 PREDICTED: probable xyloglucan galactosyltransferase GT19 isoform X2 [Tarenaya hassleriana]XP_010539754.1 PREDICTED: probable xyloglucan galactosyltransferase GT19 isoform X3 [Tarenaya hassleriana]